jgi:hypothetical protein
MTALPPSEFGGKPQHNKVQPPPHVPKPSERLMLEYTTGDQSGRTDPDAGEVFAGLRTAETQRAEREAAGLFEKGQVWEELQALGEAALGELPSGAEEQ